MKPTLAAVLLALTACGRTTAFTDPEAPALALLDAGRADASAGDASIAPTACGAVDRTLSIDGPSFEIDIHRELGSPPFALRVLAIVEGAVGARTTGRPALTTGALAAGSFVCLWNRGAIHGAGGRGGSGGNGGSGGGGDYCGRPGEKGGTALEVHVQTFIINEGEIFGGGGGGGGISACNDAAGGGGGAGRVGGEGGAGATSLSEREELEFCGQDNGIRTGVAGERGDLGGGSGGSSRSGRAGRGGDFGQRGERGFDCLGEGAGGGAGGNAIKRTSNMTNIGDGVYDTDSIKGRVGD